MSIDKGFKDVDDQVNKVMQDKIDTEINAVKYESTSHFPSFLKRSIWVEGLMLLSLLGLGSFIGYQQWQQSQQINQQSQQINQLVKQLAPTPKISPSPK